jgi:hypothetical protein
MVERTVTSSGLQPALVSRPDGLHKDSSPLAGSAPLERWTRPVAQPSAEDLARTVMGRHLRRNHGQSASIKYCEIPAETRHGFHKDSSPLAGSASLERWTRPVAQPSAEDLVANSMLGAFRPREWRPHPPFRPFPYLQPSTTGRALLLCCPSTTGCLPCLLSLAVHFSAA